VGCFEITKELKGIMKNHLRAKKSLGQHFLISKTIVGDIVRAARLTKDDTVLEVGPGKGVLTRALLASAKKVIAVEKDGSLIPLLQETFADEIKEKRFVLVHADILDLDLQTIIPKKYVVVANIPYYITGILLRKMLGDERQPSQMVLMVQKEIAGRIVARNKKESILSISVKVYGTPSIVQKVPARFFRPKPKVDSAILAIRDISKNNFVNISEWSFFELVKTGFHHKRKLLINNLGSFYQKVIMQNKFRSCDVALDARAEDLRLRDWLCLLENAFH